MSRSRPVKVIVWGLGGLAAVVVVAVLGASVVLQGPRLGALIEGALPQNRGTMKLGGVGWSLRALVDLATDAPSPISVDGLKIIDPEGTVVLDVPHLEARVKLRTLIKGSFYISDLKIGKITWRFAQMKETPEIGFLAALAPKVPAGSAPVVKKEPEGPGSFFQIADAELLDLNAIFDFPGAWGLELRNTRASASLIQSSVDPKHPVFGFDVGPVVAEGGGWLRIMDDNLMPFDKVVINRVATTLDRPDDIFLDLREAQSGRSSLVGKGYFTGIYGATSVPGIDLHAEFHDAVDMFNAVIAGKKIEGLGLSGDGATAVLDMHGSFAEIKVAARFSGLDVTYAPGYRALGVGFNLGFDGKAMKLTVRDFGFGAPGGGRFALGATLDATKLQLATDISLDGFTTDSYLPLGLQPLGGGRLDGGLHADADLGPNGPRITVRGLDIRLDRGRGGGLPRAVRVRGAAVVSPTLVRTSGLTVEVPGATATARGELRLVRRTVALTLDVLAADLARLLGSLGLPPLGQTARVSARVDGPLDSPTASGDFSATGVGVGKRRARELHARFGFAGGVARLDGLSGDLLGGRIDARGTVRLYEGSTRHMLKSPVVDAELSARDIDLALASGSDLISGHVSVDAQVRGALDAPSGTLRIPARQALVIAGHAIMAGPVDVAFDGHSVSIREARVALASGGSVNVTGTAGLDGALSVDVELRDVALAGLPEVAASGLGVTGLVSAQLHLGGSAKRPEVAGVVRLSGVGARGVRLGDGQLEIRPAIGAGTDPASPASIAVTVKGELFDRFRVDATVAQLEGKAPGTAVRATLDFDKLVLESLIPELQALGEGKGIASGRVQVDIQPGRPLSADVALSELWVSLARAVDAAPGEATTRRVEIRATKPLHVSVVGDRVTLDDLLLETNGGELHARGVLDGRQLDAAVDGHVDLELLQPVVRGYVEKLTGDLDVGLTATGSLDKPILRGRLTIRDPVHVRPKSFDTDLIVAGGVITVDPSGVEVSKLAVTLDGPTTQLDGRLTLGAGFRPETVDVHVAGEISARLLGYVADGAISDAHGRARIKADIKGPIGDPALTAWLGLGTIRFRLRDTGTEVEVQSGIVEMTKTGAVLRDVRVTIDDQGKLVIGAAGVRPGQVEIHRLVPFQLGRIDFPLHGEQLTYRSPGVFEINDLAFDLDLGGNLDDGLNLRGDVRIISGRYVQNFKLTNLVLSPRVNESAVRPFYEGKPLLADLPLDLTVRTVGDAFVVQNNVAPEIHIDVALHVGGTLSQPVLAGDVRPTDGRFHIPVLRGDFDLVPNVNHITFVETKSLADGETPEIQVEAQNPVVDTAGVEHIVRMNIHGPMREMQIDLSTDDGLDRNQTALLLLTGRTSTASDRLTTQNSTVGANLNTGIDIAGQATRDTIANLMEPIIGDTFQRAVGLELRLTVGPDGFESRLRKRISRYTNFQFDSLFGFQGQSRLALQLDQWFLDYVTIGAGVQRLTLSQEQGLSETPPWNANVELRWDFPIRR